MDDKFKQRIKEADTVITNLIAGEKIAKLSEEEKREFVNFYYKQSKLSILAAKVLYNISSNNASKEFHELDRDYECFLWVINTSYYSMFYAVHAILAFKGIRILSKEGIHKTTAHALVYYCVKNNFIAKEMYEKFVENQEKAVELMNLEDFKKKAKDLAANYLYEINKRGKFTYEIKEAAKQKHALTSVIRASEFHKHVKKIIKK